MNELALIEQQAKQLQKLIAKCKNENTKMQLLAKMQRLNDRTEDIVRALRQTRVF